MRCLELNPLLAQTPEVTFGHRIICWKDRSGHLRARWPLRPGTRYPEARLEPPGLTDNSAIPFRVVVDAETADPEADPAELAAEAVRLVAENPGAFTKSALAERLGARRQEGLSMVGRLLREGRIGPDKPRARLRVLSEGSQVPKLL